VLVVAALTVASLTFTVGRYLFRSHPGAKSVDAAVAQVRAASSTSSPETVTFARPAVGVYEAAGEGKESVSAPPNSQDDGATMPITIRYLRNGGWNWHEFDFCPQGNELLLVAQRNYQAWDFGALKVSNLGPYTCDPPAPGPSTSAGLSTIVGRETLTIGGAPVEAIHQTRVQQMTGAQVGDVTEDWWFAPGTGLPLRAERTYKLDTTSVIGKITYREHGSWQLTSLEPRT
jgi:hypothetical protein